MSPWTLEKVETLVVRWGQGASCLEIGAEIGMSVGAIVGKVHRLGLPARASGGGYMVRKPRKARPGRGVLQSIQSRAKRAEALPPEPTLPPHEFDLAIPAEQRTQLVDLTDRTCRWPVGDVGASDFFFCGGAPIEGQPYCDPHCRRAFNFEPRVPYRRAA